jgi:hypothetical protein
MELWDARAHLEGVQCEFRLVERILGPGATSSHVRSTIVQHDFSLIAHQGNVLERLAAAVPSAASSLASATDGICPEQKDT